MSSRNASAAFRGAVSRGALLVVLILCATRPAPAEDQFRLKPGAKGKICLGCHVTFEDTMALPFIHTPVKAGDCSDCHNPHAAIHGKLLSEDPSEICLDCHEGIVPTESLSAHDAAVAGDCVACHDPHASQFKNQLVRKGNDLCNGCHQEIADGIAAASFGHSPVEEDCLSCHVAHASTDSPSLLTGEIGSLCTTCHDAGAPSFAKRHMNYPVGNARCTECHDPHGSSQAGLLWANVHVPVVNKMCNQCHENASSANPLAIRKEGIDLCRGCHIDTINETFARTRIHWALVGKDSCLNCHGAHASPEAALLRAPSKLLCGSCHPDTVARQEASQSKHAPVEQGECALCHSPHSANGAFLLVESDVPELCGGCHDWQKHSTHPIGAEIVDQRNPNLTLDCLSCHRSHGSEFKYFAHANPSRELCTDCHEDLRR